MAHLWTFSSLLALVVCIFIHMFIIYNTFILLPHIFPFSNSLSSSVIKFHLPEYRFYRLHYYTYLTYLNLYVFNVCVLRVCVCVYFSTPRFVSQIFISQREKKVKKKEIKISCCYRIPIKIVVICAFLVRS